MVETVLQHSKDRVENRGRGSATPTQMDVWIVTAKYVSQPLGKNDYVRWLKNTG